MIPFILTVASLALALLFISLVFMRIRLKQMAQSQRILQEFTEEEVIAYTTAANYIGLASKGYGQLRGNGFLLLTQDQLVFERLAPRLRMGIPLRSIVRVDQVSSFLGKRSIKPVLRIHFLDANGEQDQMGMLLSDPAHWAALLQSAYQQKRKIA